MFSQIFLFELRYRLRRPAFYIYFAIVLAFTILYFAKGDLGRAEKEWINSPAQLAEFCTSLSIFLLLVSSAIMGTPLYRDLEHNTKEYYLSYPITKAGYFWGRFFGSFLFVLAISFAIIIGIWLGCAIGPATSGKPVSAYGPNNVLNYLSPWLIFVVPTLFFTSALFFGLVAVFRNVKVIYSSGLFFFLGYILGNFFLHNIHNNTVIYLVDPFLQNGMRISVSGISGEDLNHFPIRLTGLVLENRVLWVSIGSLVLAFTWWYFSFERFFSGRASKDKTSAVAPITSVHPGRNIHIELKGAYYRRILTSLTRIELLNIIRDNYFWIILSGGYIFLSFVFWHGPGRFDVHDYPRTVFFVDIFSDIFLFFIFLIIVFYTGETVHREKATLFSFINDALPPPDWVFNAAKLLSLCILALFLALTPMIIGLPIQLLKGSPHFNFTQYLSSTFITILPKLIVMVLLCYSIHLIVNNKFAGHGVAITIWTAMFCVVIMNYFSYFLLLYSYTPFIWASDMDGIGHMITPISWYNVYWTVAGLLLIVLSSLFFARGVSRSMLERIRLARDRFQGPARAGAIVGLVLFLMIGGWIYYNVSYLNEFTTPWERNERKALVEKGLKHYASLPLPKITRMTMHVDLFPDHQQEQTTAWVTVINPSDRPIDTLLIDGDGLDFDIKVNDAALAYTCPLYLPRGKFNLFRPSKEPSDYRLYVLPKALRPGDTTQFQVHSNLHFQGFQNGLYAGNALRNGMFTTGNLPGLGYDEGDEIGDNEIRRKHGLPEKKETDIAWNDPVGRRTPSTGVNADCIPYDLTVSTAGDQRIAAPGRLVQEYTTGDRHYYHFVQDQPGIYPPVALLSSRFAQWTDTVRLDNGKTVRLTIDYHPDHDVNLIHYQQALKEGLRYYSKAFGPYPYDRLSLAESPAYGRREMSIPGVIYIGEPMGWCADLRDRGSFDYIYYEVAIQLAHQWWGNSLVSNNTLAARVIDVGVSHYAALALLARRADSTQSRRALEFLRGDYGWGHRTDFDGERPLINADKWYQWDARTALQLRALAQTIGADSLNAALRDFYATWSLRPTGPYPGAHDLYDALAAHIPDSLHAWFADAWFKAPTGPPAPPVTAPAKSAFAAKK